MSLRNCRRNAASFRRPRRRTHTAGLPAEVLEQRRLLTGLVMEESVFSVMQFARNIEEQIPVDTTGPNGVVGYSYAIINGDPANPISDAGDGVFKGNRRMIWDTRFQLTSRPADPDEPQEIASVSKMITGATIMLLLQEKVHADHPELDPVDDAQQFRGFLETELDRPIVNFLPGNWGPGNPLPAINGWTPFFNSITIRELLTHTSGLLGDTSTGGVVTGPAGVSPYTYGGLQQIAEGGTVNVNSLSDLTWAADYWTNNFSWFRVMLPYMWGEVDNAALNANASSGLLPTDPEKTPFSPMISASATLADDLIDAMIDDWGTGVAPDANGVMSITPGQVTASIYKFYVSEYLLKPSGVLNPKSRTSGFNFTLLYPLDPWVVPGSREYGPILVAQQNGQDTGNLTGQLGPRGWNLSAKDAVRAISGIRHGATNGSTILYGVTLDLMDEQGLGYQHSTNGNYVGDFGQYWGHNGVNFAPPALPGVLPASVPAGAGTPPTLAPANNTVAIAFPNNVEAAILFNSQIQSIDGPGPPNPVDARTQVVIGAAFNSGSPAFSGPTSVGTGTNTTLINAYDNAWTELVYDGDNAADGVVIPGDEHDNFRISLNPVSAANPSGPQFIDFFHDNMTTPLFSRRIDTLTKLTINGLDGINTCTIDNLPASLEVVINGGNLLDIVVVGDPSVGTDDLDLAPGTLTFIGGTGFSQFFINDSAQNTATTYFVRDDQVTRGSGTYNYNHVDILTLNAGSAGDDIFVQSTHAATLTNISALGGQDEITIGGAHIDFVDGPINITGGTNFDLVRFSDIFSGSSHQYEIDAGRTVIDDSVTVTYDVENLELRAGWSDDIIDVNSLTSGQTQEIFTNDGEDLVSVNLLSNPLTTSVLGKVIVHGGSDGDDTLTVNDATSLNGTDYTISRTKVTRTGIQDIEYDGMESLNVNGAIPASTYHVEGTSAETSVTGGIGADTFEVGFIQRLDFIDGFLTINGGDNVGGEDTVEINDRTGSSELFGVVNNAVFGFTFATIFLNDIEHATLEANSLDNQILIENAPGPTRYTVNGWFGVDTFTVAEGSRNLSTFDTPLVLNGGPIDENHLVLRDDSSPGNLSWTVTENSIDRLLFGERSQVNTDIGVTFSAMTSVELHMNDLNSHVNVQSTHPDTRYIFHGNDGSDTLNLNRDTDDDVDPLVVINGVDITSSAMDIEHNDFEQLNLNLGGERNTVRLHSLQSPADIKLGPGNDRLLVTPNSGNLNAIHYPITVNGQGGFDRVHLLDQNNGGTAPFTVTKNTVSRFLFGPLVAPGLTYFDMEILRLLMGSGDNVVNIDSTASGTEYFVGGGAGDDTFSVNLLPTAPLTLFGNAGSDHAVITGDDNDNEVSISAGFGSADINLPNTETAYFDGHGGTDVLVAQGVAGMTEQMEIEASGAASAGHLRITTLNPRGNNLLDAVFEDAEILDLIANPGDDDTAAFIGTDDSDRFEINLGAAGTNADPVLQLFQPGGTTPLLTLRDYRDFATLNILGEDGGDEFNVHVAPTGPGSGRNLNVDGGSPGGPGNPHNKDRLNVFRAFQQPPPPPGNNGQNSTPDGSIDIVYEYYEFLIEYSGMEKVKVRKAGSGNGNGNGKGNGKD